MKKFILMAFSFLAGPALAQDQVNSHGFWMAPTDGDVLAPISTWRAKRYDGPMVGFNSLFEYAYRPLTLHEKVNNVEYETVLVDNLSVLNLGGFFAPNERLAFGVSLPLFLGADELGTQSGMGLGNIRTSVPLGIIVPDSGTAFGLTLIPHIDLPTSVGNHVYLSTEDIAGGAVIATSLTFDDKVDVSANVGVDFTPKIQFYNLNGRENLVSRVSTSYALTDSLAIRGEWLFRPSLRDNLYNGTESPMEMQLSLKGKSAPLGWTIGGAKSLNRGASAAVWRAFAGIDLSFDKKDKQLVQEDLIEEVFITEECPPCNDLVCVSDKELVLLKPIVFDFNQDTIRMPDSFEILMALIETLRNHTEILKIQIGTGTDVRGSDEYNLDLSERRAKNVVKFLTQNGVAPERLMAVGFGERYPLFANCVTEECHEANRYALITILEVSE